MNAPLRALTAAFTIAWTLTGVGCQTPRHKEFERVKEGMEKADVLEALGNPTRTQRWQGKDRWIYVYTPTADAIDTKEIHFLEGRVVYHGVPIAPEISAEEQDRRNEESNVAVEKTLKAEDEAAKASIRQGADWLNGNSAAPVPPPRKGGAD